MKNLLTPSEVDAILRYRAGRSKHLAKVGTIPCVCLPDGEIRFLESDIRGILSHANGDEDIDGRDRFAGERGTCTQMKRDM